MSYYSIAYMKTAITSFLTKKDFENILSAKTLDQAIKTIIDKPIGSYVYEKIYGKTISIDVISNYVSKYEYEKLNNLYRNMSKKSRKVFDTYKLFFDIYNTLIVASSILTSGKGKPLYIWSNLTATEEIGDLETLYEIVPRTLKFQVKEIMNTNKVSYSELLKLLPSRKDLSYMTHNSLTIYGLFNDLYLLRECITRKEPIEPVSLFIFSRDEYKYLCDQKTIESLINYFRTSNKVLQDVGEALNFLMRFNKATTNLDIVPFIVGIKYSSSLINTETDLATKLLLLSLSEAYVLRTILVYIDTGMYKEIVDELVYRWWPL